MKPAIIRGLLLAGTVWACSANAQLTADYEIYTTIGGSFDGTPFSGAPALTGTRSAVASTLFAGYQGISLSPAGETDIGYFPFPTYSARILGNFQLTAAGTYSFGTYSDDGSTLYIDGNLIVNNGGAHSPQSIFASTVLSAGPHSFVVNYFEDFAGEANLTAYFDPAALPVPEPTTLGLFALGCGLMLLRRK
jgi:hypothetical protein